MAIHKLTPRKVSTAGPGKYEDGGGLRLVVANSGAKKWVLRFTINGKRREMGLGSFPDVGLADARDKAAERRKQATAGIDPIEARRAEPEKAPPSPPARPVTSGHTGAAGRTPSTPGSG